MQLTDIMRELEQMGSESTKRTLLKHGAREPFFGVKVGDMKKIVKVIKKDHALSLDLFDTGNSDAMYLAGLIADEKKISKDELRHWADKAYWYMLSGYTVPWVAAESPHGWELGLEWINSDRSTIASTGWSTLASWVIIRPDAVLDMQALTGLVERTVATYKDAPNWVRFAMNAFLTAIGVSVKPLTELAIDAGRRIGKLDVDTSNLALRLPNIEQYIENARQKGKLGMKKKQARC
jgi:3-methyladenine DNA glycosylase AlkD